MERDSTAGSAGFVSAGIFAFMLLKYKGRQGSSFSAFAGISSAAALFAVLFRE